MITVTGTYLHADDTTPGVGEVSFVPHIVAVHEDPAPHITVQEPITVTLDGSGAFSVDLIASDDPAWQADGNVPYLVTERVGGLRRSYSVELLPDGSTVDLADLLPLAESPDVGASHDHGRLIGLADDDHPQYLTEARADALYSDLAHAARHGSGGADEVTVAQSQVTGLGAALALLAPLASPTFTGTPAAPTQSNGDNSTKIATTAYVAGQILVDHPNTDDVRVRVRSSAGVLQTVHYDSGWRNVTALLINGWTVGASGYVYLRRTLNDLQFAVNALRDDAPATSNNVMLMPSGFAALTTNTRGQAIGNWNYTKFIPTAVNGGYLNLPKGLGGVEYYGSFIIPASATFSAPTSLPGTLVSAAPA